MSAALGALLALGLAATVFLPRTTVRGPAVHLFRAFFPSWRFFEDTGPAPRLMHRLVGPDGTTGPWLDTLPPVSRGPLALLYNPAGNLRLAFGSLVDQLVAELATIDEAALARGDLRALDALVPYRLVRRLVSERVGSGLAPAPAPALAFQIRLVLDDPRCAPDEREVVFESPVLTAEAARDDGAPP
ncbi:hypothetical protein L6V77_23965 [Myxococcota bacterium]|nr:hypothetical protein [Myxococcota bacterium]